MYCEGYRNPSLITTAWRFGLKTTARTASSKLPTTTGSYTKSSSARRSRRNVSRISGHMARSAGETSRISKYGRRAWPRPIDGGRMSGAWVSPSSSAFQGAMSSR